MKILHRFDVVLNLRQADEFIDAWTVNGGPGRAMLCQPRWSEDEMSLRCIVLDEPAAEFVASLIGQKEP